MKIILSAEFFQRLTMLLVLASFVSANFGNEFALRLWLEGWEAISALIGLGVGLKMADRHFTRRAEIKYRARGESITVVDGEEP